MDPALLHESSTGFDRLTRAKSFFDVLFAGATLLYALGYSSWALYAWDMQLGVPPLLNSQYLVAGVIPALIVVTSFLIVAWLRKVRGKIKHEPSEKRKRIGRVLKGAGGTLIVLSALIELIGFSNVYWAVAAPGLLCFAAGALLSPTDWIDRWFAIGTAWYLSASVILLSFSLVLLYSSRVFPKLPPELGGPSPQCVTLDVDPRQLSANTTASLMEKDGTAGTPAVVVRTKPLFLLFPGSLYILAPSDTTIRGKAFRLRESAIEGVFPASGCGRPSKP